MASGEQVREASLCDKSKHSNSFLGSIYQQKLLTKFCDVVMKVCNREIHAHSNVLAATSPYFENFLSLDLPRLFSQKSPQIIEIQIDGTEPNFLYEEAVEDVITYIYTGMMKVKDYNVSQIYEISKIMQLDTVMSFCEDFLQGKIESKSVQVVSGLNQNQIHESSMNTEITGVNFPLMPEMWSMLAKNKDPTSSIFSPKNKYRKMVSVSVQTTPIDFMARGKKDFHVSLPLLKEVRLIDPFNVDISNIGNRKRPLEAETTPVSSVNSNTRTESLNCHNGVISKYDQEAKKTKLDAEIAEKVTTIESDVSTHIIVQNGSVNITKRVDSETPSGDDADVTVVKSSDDNSHIQDIQEACTPSENSNNPVVNIVNVEITKHEINQPSNVEIQLENINVDDEDRMQQNVLLIEETIKSAINVSSENAVQVANEIIAEEESVDLSEACLAELEEGEVVAINSAVKGLPEVIHSISDLQVIEQSENSVTSDADGRTPDTQFKKRGRPRKMPPAVSGIKLEFEKNSKEYSCTECNYVTTKVREMSSHMKLHKMDQGVCFYCDIMIEDKEELILHVKTHKGASPFLCTECGLSFKTRTMLNLHLPKHSDQKPFICEICSMAFKWKHALKNHMVTHSNKREHLCDICGYSTAHKAQLKSHRLIHTGETFKCEVQGCNFETTKKQNLKYHEITHTRERPHQCEICGQNFSLYKNMKRHMLLHFSEKTHRCKCCEFASTRYDKLKEHLLKQHCIGTPPERRVKVADMLATSNINIEVQPGRFVSAGEKPNPLVIEPINTDVEESIRESSTNGVHLGKADSDTYILHKLLNDSGGNTVLSSEHKLTLLDKDGSATQVLIHKLDESGQAVIEQSTLAAEQPSQQLLHQSSQINGLNTSEPAELSTSNQTPLETVTSIMVASDGSQVVDGEQCGFISVEELAAKLGLPGNINLSTLFKTGSSQSGDDSGSLENLTGDGRASVVEIQNSSLGFATNSEGILLNSNESVELPIQVTTKQEGDTVEYMEVLVQETDQQLATSIASL